ncbi:hypothetical protein VP01_1660g6 [Puccinia sorghi]|uniref:Uncharacterized protein n=1 Tax=Puccinia sorghi TaxID=27349 RepID=A0A0L6VGD3_9BASI|nr:hypothetical protein VP01_1660g6 [Puccinia sorghi]
MYKAVVKASSAESSSRLGNQMQRPKKDKYQCCLSQTRLLLGKGNFDERKMMVYNHPMIQGLRLIKGFCKGVLLGKDVVAEFPSLYKLPHSVWNSHILCIQFDFATHLTRHQFSLTVVLILSHRPSICRNPFCALQLFYQGSPLKVKDELPLSKEM